MSELHVVCFVWLENEFTFLKDARQIYVAASTAAETVNQ